MVDTTAPAKDNDTITVSRSELKALVRQGVAEYFDDIKKKEVEAKGKLANNRDMVQITLFAREAKGLKTSYDVLADVVKGKGLSRSDVSMALDSLFDVGIVKAVWEKSADGNPYRSLTIAPEAREFVKILYDNRAELGYDKA